MKIRAAYLPVVVFLTLSVQMIAQNRLDISQCFNSLLQQRHESASYTRVKLALLAQVTEKNYEEYKHSGALDVIGIGSGSWNDFASKRKEYFSSLNIDLDYFQSISLSSMTLDKPAYDTINKCIEQVANSSDNYGLHFLPAVDSDSDASIRFYWRPLHPEKLQVVDSTLENAEVVGGRVSNQPVDKGKLFPKPEWWQVLTPYPEVNESGPTILLKRIDSTKPIKISITTKPEVGTSPIAIPLLPKEPKLETFFYPENVTRSYPKAQILTREPGIEGQIFRLSDQVPGMVIKVECTYRGYSHHHQVNCGPLSNGSTQYKCEGFTNDGNNISLIANVGYLATYVKCVDNCGDEKKSILKPPPSDNPDSYTFNVSRQLTDGEQTCIWELASNDVGVTVASASNLAIPR